MSKGLKQAVLIVLKSIKSITKKFIRIDKTFNRDCILDNSKTL